MSLLTVEDKAFFVENGYLIRHDMLSEGQIQEAVDTLWRYIKADRDDPQTWVRCRTEESRLFESSGDSRDALRNGFVCDVQRIGRRFER